MIGSPDSTKVCNGEEFRMLRCGLMSFGSKEHPRILYLLSARCSFDPVFFYASGSANSMLLTKRILCYRPALLSRQPIRCRFILGHVLSTSDHRLPFFIDDALLSSMKRGKMCACHPATPDVSRLRSIVPQSRHTTVDASASDPIPQTGKAEFSLLAS